MKKQYTAMKVEKIDFGAYDMATASVPSSCMRIVANVVEAGTQVCANPSSTTSYLWIGDRDPNWD